MLNADENHFVDVNEMVLDAVSTIETRQFRLLENSLKIAIIFVSQNPCKIPAGPKLHPSIISTFDLLEWRMMAPRVSLDFFAHVVRTIRE